MSKSFDEKMRERLGDYSYQPPEGAKDKILEKAPSPSKGLFYFYQSMSAVLILLALFKIGSTSNERVEITPDLLSASVGHKGTVEKDTGNEPVRGIAGVIKEEEKPEPVIPISEENVTISEIAQEKTVKERGFPSFSILTRGDIFRYPAGLVGIPVLTDETNRGLLPNPLYSRRYTKRIIPQKEKWASPYYNAGAFFIYNRFRPNISDDIYVGEYDAPFSLSASRLGFVAEFGLHKQWNKGLASRIGINVNNYSQSYSFSVRNTRPDSVSVNELDRFLEPHFDAENVQISERVTLIGIKAQGFLYVFHNTSNVLFASVEYQQLLGKGPMFTYQNKEHSLMKPSQYLAEVGLRKTIFEFKNANLFAMPSIRYSLTGLGDQKIINVKPFSVGITISYGMK